MCTNQDVLIFMAIGFAVGVIVTLVVIMNISEHKRRSKLTQEERDQEDEELRIPGDW